MARPAEGGKSPDFHISEKWLNLYQSICRRGRARGEGYPLFDKYTNFYTLCASIGFRLGKKTKLNKSCSPFTLEQVDEDMEWPALQAIAWKDLGMEMGVFVNSRQVIEICNQYAETGIQKLVDKCLVDYLHEDGQLLRPANLDLEITLCHLIEIIKKETPPL